MFPAVSENIDAARSGQRSRPPHPTDSEYLTLGCFNAAILIVLIAIGFRVSYDFGLAGKEPQHSSHLLI